MAPRSAAAGAHAGEHGGSCVTSELFSGVRFSSIELDICYPAAWGGSGMEAALAKVAAHVEENAIHQGLQHHHPLRSHRRAPIRCLYLDCIPPAAVHEHLVKKGLAYVDRLWSSKLARCAKCISSRCSGVTVPRRSIRISGSRRSPTCRARKPKIEPKQGEQA